MTASVDDSTTSTTSYEDYRDDDAGPAVITVVLESRDSYAFAATCWFIHSLDPSKEALMTVLNARDQPGNGPMRKVLLLAHGEGVVTTQEWGPITYSVTTSEPLSTDGRPEPFRRLLLEGEESGIMGMINRALDEYRCHVMLRDDNDHHDGVPMWAWDADSGMWERSKSKRRRPMQTLHTTPEARRLTQDFYNFTATETLDMYKTLHVAPTRVYMLHGLPGSGKTSLVHCMASEIGYGIAMMSFTPGTTDADVKAALGCLPTRCLLCIEDIDCLFVDGHPDGGGGGRKMASATSSMTFAGLLAALDGCGDATGGSTGVFLTTNRLCVLDPALRRRIDYVLEFGAATREQVFGMFCQYFPRQRDAFDGFWQGVRGRQASMCQIQKQMLRGLKTGDPLADLDQFESQTTQHPGMYS